MDATEAQPPRSPPAYMRPAAAAIDYGPANAEDAKLCHEAGEFAWAYFSTMILADAGAIVLDTQVFQNSDHAGERLIGPGLVGLSWGWSVGGTYLTLPHCSADYVRSRPLEGSTRSAWPLALGFTLLAGVVGPVIVGVETGEGAKTLQWSGAERAMRLVLAGGTGVVGSLLPYVLPPSTWRAVRKLDRLHARADAHGAWLSYSVRF